MRDRETILAFMKETGVTANRLSDEAGVNASCVYRVLTDSRAGLSVRTLDKLEDAISRYSKRTNTFRPRKASASGRRAQWG